MKRLVFVAVLVVFLPALVSGQEATGRLAGAITDPQGGALPGVTVTVRLGAATVATAITGADGRFSADVRPGGPYALEVQLSGFAVQEKRDLFVARGKETRADFQLQISLSEQVTVTAGAILARDEKRAAPTITDVVSADSVGRFPDANAAESLRRMPGVSLEIDQGEGRFVVVRGIDASLNNVTLNGQVVGTPAEFGTRGVSMDSVPADLISRLEVVKAVRPDMDANAIGASINIATRGAFELPGGFFIGSVRSGYNEMGGPAPVNASASIGRTVGAKWGYVVGASYSQRRFNTELYRASDGTWTNFNGFFVPQTQARFLYDIERIRQGVNGSIEFRPATGHTLTLRANHNQFQDTEARQQVEFDFTRGTLQNQTPTSGTFTQGRASREFRDYRQKHLINAAMISGSHVAGNSLLDWNAGASRGERETPFRADWEFRSSGGAFPNSYDVSDPSLPIVTPNEAFYNASSYPFRRVRFREDIEREDVISGEVNFRRDASIVGRSGYWKIGAKLVDRDKTQDRTNDNYIAGSPNFRLSDFGLGGEGPDDFFKGHFRFGPTLNIQALKDFFAQNSNRFVHDPLSTLQNSLEQDFNASETVYAGYGMASVNLSSKMNLLFGLRVEATQGDYFANELVFEDGVFTGRVNPASGSNNYTHVLPGVHLNYAIAQNLMLRAAWTNTIARPAYADLAPIRALDEIQDTDGTWTGSLSEGNSTLKPYESMNFDVSLEYYIPQGLISVAPFYKRIENPIYGRQTLERNVTYNDRVYDIFSFDRPENADSGHVAGIEFNYQQTYSMLPSPLDGLGANINVTLADSSVTVFGRENDDLPFFKQSETIGNVSATYQKHGIEAQLTYSFESPSFVSVGEDTDSDRYNDSYNRLDAKASYPLVGNLRLVVEARNLNDQPRREYVGIRDRRVQDEIYGRDYYGGLDWRF